MIQDIAPLRLDNHWQPGQVVREDSVVFHFRDEQVLVRAQGVAAEPLFPTAAQLGGVAQLGECRYLFSIDGRGYFLCLAAQVAVPAGYGYEPARQVRTAKQAALSDFYAFYTAWHLATWYRSNRFCGRCGQPMQPDTAERAMRCPACGHIEYPRINPAIIAGVIHDDEILLTQYATQHTGHRSTFYALIAGFTEIGETLEETVQREVYEEVGLYVRNVRYYKSQPWGSAADILAGFFCDVDGSTDIHRDTRELRRALWVPRREVQLQPDDWSLTNEMMQRFKEGQPC
ncbi:MAG TPA: NAD(+) diphosphatase [Selenomonas sp.]|jgi:NAD+ diphosphatase|nr:NAD(+) diphosphatase [Selenomonas sp.]